MWVGFQDLLVSKFSVLVLPAKANRPQALGKIALLILSLPAHGIPPAGFWAARLARQELVRVLNLPASAALSGKSRRACKVASGAGDLPNSVLA